MKNTIIISIDTESKQPIAIGKPDAITPPSNREEAGTMILNDIDCVTETLLFMLEMVHVNDYGDKQQLGAGIMSKITSYLNPNPSEHPKNPEESINRENQK